MTRFALRLAGAAALAASCFLVPLSRAHGEPARAPSRDVDPAQSVLIPPELEDVYFPRGKNYPMPRVERVSAIMERAKAYESAGSRASAARAYDSAYRRVSGSPAAPYIRFKQCTLLSDLERSIAGLEEIRSDYPGFALLEAVMFELAKLHYVKGEYGKAADVLEEMLENPSEHLGVALKPYAHAFLCELSLRRSRPDDAIEHANRSIGELRGRAAPQTGEPIVRVYLGAARALVASGRALAAAGELLRRVAGSSRDPILRHEASSLLETLPRGSGNADLSPLIDEALLNGDYLVTPQGLLPAVRGRDGTAGGDADGVSSTATSGGFSLQVGSFGRRENAERVVSELRAKGFSAYIAQAEVDGKTVFRVRVGSFPQLGDAEKARNELQGLGYRGFVLSER